MNAAVMSPVTKPGLRRLAQWWVEPLVEPLVRRRDGTRRADVGGWLAVSTAALLMAVSADIHVHLWTVAYRHVATLGPLFLVQAVAALVGALVLVVGRRVWVALGCLVLMTGVVLGFVLADTMGIFGFRLPVVTSWADASMAAELLCSVLLAALVVRASPSQLVRDIVAEVSRAAGRPFGAAADLVLATMACHGSTRAGDTLAREEAEALLRALDTVDFAGHCPHGRPVVTRIAWGELERRVGR